jgi:hypothetical protein
VRPAVKGGFVPGVHPGASVCLLGRSRQHTFVLPQRRWVVPPRGFDPLDYKNQKKVSLETDLFLVSVTRLLAFLVSTAAVFVLVFSEVVDA